MPIKIKSTSSNYRKRNKITGLSFFASNDVIQKNPHLVSLLLSPVPKIQLKNESKNKQNIDTEIKEEKNHTKTKTQPKNKENDQGLNQSHNKLTLIYLWKLEAKKRYYNIYLQLNLLGLWSVLCEWGSTTHKQNQYKVEIYDNYEEAVDYINQLNQIKRKRNYVLQK